MKVLIVYATRTGTTAKAAGLLAGYFRDTVLVDLDKESPDPSAYDAVIFGSAIRNGRILRPLSRWLTRYWSAVAPMTKGVFICNAFLNESPDLLRENFSLNLRNASAAVESFGGEFTLSKISGMERILYWPMLKRLTRGGAAEFVPCLLPDRIEHFAEEMLDAMREE